MTYPTVSIAAAYRINARTTTAGPPSLPKAWLSPARPRQAWKRNTAESAIRITPSQNGKKPGCGSVGAPGNGLSGRDWMRDSNENCANLP